MGRDGLSSKGTSNRSPGRTNSLVSTASTGSLNEAESDDEDEDDDYDDEGEEAEGKVCCSIVFVVLCISEVWPTGLCAWPGGVNEDLLHGGKALKDY